MEHPISQRIKIIIERESSGKVVDFAKKLNGVSYQVISRLYKIEPKTQKYPTPTTDLITEIIRTFISYNPNWLLTGEGEMLKSEKIYDSEDLNKNIVAETLAYDSNSSEYWKGRFDQLREDYRLLLEKIEKK